MPYLVDGNNLAHALGLSHEGLADRQACARSVASFCQKQGARATVVFDGPAPSGPDRPGDAVRVRVVFSGSGTADDMILKALVSSKNARDFIVVTSDKSLGDKARHQGAAIEKCHEFARKLRPTSAVDRQHEGKEPRVETEQEVQDWLDIFDPHRK